MAKALKSRFRAGQVYDFMDWFTGGISRRKILSVNDNKVVYQLEQRELDGSFIKEETSEIKTDTNGEEYLFIYEYEGNEARIYAQKEEVEYNVGVRRYNY